MKKPIPEQTESEVNLKLSHFGRWLSAATEKEARRACYSLFTAVNTRERNSKNTGTSDPVVGFAGSKKAVGKTVASVRLYTHHGMSLVIDPVDSDAALGVLRDAGGLLVWVGPRDHGEICRSAQHYLASIQDVGYEEYLGHVDRLAEELRGC